MELTLGFLQASGLFPQQTNKEGRREGLFPGLRDVSESVIQASRLLETSRLITPKEAASSPSSPARRRPSLMFQKNRPLAVALCSAGFRPEVWILRGCRP